MRLTKPNWVEHADEKGNKCPIYSISVHPDGTRLATGGLDRKVKIWNTLPVIDEEADKNEQNPKLLCTMSTHTGSVLAVRWAHNGRYLASGSDDQVLVVWCLDAGGGGRVWGSDEVNVENWKVRARLVGHTSDIIDVAWSRDDSMLASVGLDNNIWIWDGDTFDRIHKISGHEGFVKGVCWDPVGSYLATQSDDRTVKVWRTDTWKEETSISKPFAQSPSSTFFRRLSWSPDGAFIAASNAMLDKVFVASVIEREGWNSDISFVGHQNTIQVAAFNPRLFFAPGTEPNRITASCMVALGADDFSISIWRNTRHKPMVVLKEVFGRNLMDLCWSNDGLHLYGCSEDGTICAISFEAKEFPDLSEPSNTDLILKEYGYQPKRHATRALSTQPSLQMQPPAFPSGPIQPVGHVNVLQPRKSKPGDNRRRVHLSNSNASSRDARPTPVRVPLGPASSLNDPFNAPIQHHSDPSSTSGARMLQNAPSSSAFANGYGEQPRGFKRKASADAGFQGRSMTSTQPRVQAEIRELRAPRVNSMGGSSRAGPSRSLAMPSVQSVLRSKPIDGASDVYLEAENSDDDKGKNVITFNRDGEDVWLDYLPAAVLSMAVSENFSAVACEDGDLRVYTSAGRHNFTVRLDSPIYDLVARNHMLFVVTTDCQARVYHTRTAKALFLPCSISHIVSGAEIVKLDIRPNGTPIIITSEPAAYAYNQDLQDWTAICSAWYLSNSPSSSRQRPGPNGPLAKIEAICRQALPPDLANGNGHGHRAGDKGKEADQADWWDEALEMGLLDTRIQAAEMLGSGEEYKFWVREYAGLVARESFVQRAEELLEELMGPGISIPIEDESRRSRGKHVGNVSKRDLAHEVMDIIERETATAEIAQRYRVISRIMARTTV